MKKKLDWIDLSKGLGIILVVLGHAIVPSVREESSTATLVYNMIYIFHMQLFFFASGYLFERQLDKYVSDKRGFIINKLRYLMLPYLVFSLINGAIIAAATAVPALSALLGNASIKDMLVNIVIFHDPFDTHLWFVYTLFIIFLLNIAFPKITRHPATVVLFFLLICTKPLLKLPGILDYVRNELFIFSFARFMYANDFMELIFKKKLSLIVPFVFLIADTAIASLYITGLPVTLLGGCLFYAARAATGMLGAISVFILMNKLNSGSGIGRFFKTLSGYSYGIYLIHTPFIVPAVVAILHKATPIPVGLIILIAACIGITASIFITALIRKFGVLRLLFLGEKPEKKI